MGAFENFFRNNAETYAVEKTVISERFKDKDGKAEEWELRAINAAFDRGLRMAEPKDSESYLGRLCAACVIYPNLNDTALQNSYGVMGADRLLREMLMPGEYAFLIKCVKKINGFDRDFNSLVKEAKN